MAPPTVDERHKDFEIPSASQQEVDPIQASLNGGSGKEEGITTHPKGLATGVLDMFFTAVIDFSIKLLFGIDNDELVLDID